MTIDDLQKLSLQLDQNEIPPELYLKFAMHRENAYRFVLNIVEDDESSPYVIRNGLLIMFDLCKQACQNKKSQTVKTIMKFLQNSDVNIRSTSVGVGLGFINLSKIYPGLYSLSAEELQGLESSIRDAERKGVNKTVADYIQKVL